MNEHLLPRADVTSPSARSTVVRSDPRSGKKTRIEATYFEDFQVDDTLDLDSHRVSEEEIIEFARCYDPQEFHVDPAAARNSIFHGLVASGIHTMAIFMRLAVDSFLGPSASLGSPGLESVSFPTPLRPGDSLYGKVIIASARPSRTQPAWGLLSWKGHGTNQHAQPVLDLTVTGFFRRRP